MVETLQLLNLIFALILQIACVYNADSSNLLNKEDKDKAELCHI